MISQPVDVRLDHSGLRINLKRSNEDDDGVGLYDKMDDDGKKER